MTVAVASQSVAVGPAEKALYRRSAVGRVTRAEAHCELRYVTLARLRLAEHVTGAAGPRERAAGERASDPDQSGNPPTGRERRKGLRRNRDFCPWGAKRDPLDPPAAPVGCQNIPKCFSISRFVTLFTHFDLA
jgi:hypothetical protein